MATIVQTVIRRRGVIGKIFLLIFWLFNVAALFVTYAMVDYAYRVREAAPELSTYPTELLRTLLVIWVICDVILYFPVALTRGRKVILEEALPVVRAPRPPSYSKWRHIKHGDSKEES